VNVLGLDLDEELVGRARGQAPRPHVQAEFQALDVVKDEERWVLARRRRWRAAGVW
jgi:hypothetical protein